MQGDKYEAVLVTQKELLHGLVQGEISNIVIGLTRPYQADVEKLANHKQL